LDVVGGWGYFTGWQPLESNFLLGFGSVSFDVFSDYSVMVAFFFNASIDLAKHQQSIHCIMCKLKIVTSFPKNLN